MKNRIALADCEICRELDHHNYFNIIGGETLSDAAEKLVGNTVGKDMFENYSLCPICETHYKNTNECGFMENDVTLIRMSPTEAGEKLKPEDLVFFEAGLSSENARQKEYSSQALTDYRASIKAS